MTLVSCAIFLLMRSWRSGNTSVDIMITDSDYREIEIRILVAVALSSRNTLEIP